jgi:hypothetical protein
MGYCTNCHKKHLASVTDLLLRAFLARNIGLAKDVAGLIARALVSVT